MHMQRHRVRRGWTGHRIGESHPKARLTDADVRLIRELREEHGLSFGELAKKFEAGRSTIFNICQYKTRAHPV